MLCIGVINMHSAGIGGGGFMTVYDRCTGKVEVIDYREEAPGKANRTMYVNSSRKSRYGEINRCYIVIEKRHNDVCKLVEQQVPCWSHTPFFKMATSLIYFSFFSN